MRVFIVCGGRNYRDYEALTAALDRAKPDVIIQGECPTKVNADKMAKRYAWERGIPCIGVEANFEFYGKPGGPKRNRWMATLLGPITGVIAFPGERGTNSMMDIADELGIKIWEPCGSTRESSRHAQKSLHQTPESRGFPAS